MIIRHGEKPEPGASEGVGPEGESDPASLATEGWKRAKKLVGFFVGADAPGIATPTMIFACKAVQDSRRPIETVSLLANAIWNDAEPTAHFNTQIDREDVESLAAAVKATQCVCLIAWEHHLIPNVAAASTSFGCSTHIAAIGRSARRQRTCCMATRTNR
jgi:hypothetical protein